jgi:MFS family permease
MSLHRFNTARGEETTAQRSLPFIVFATSLGTLIEWYDFYIYAILAVLLAGKFFPGALKNSFLASLAALWAGFAVRPFGAGFFGYLGDAVGRKFTFLATLLLMGGATVGVGLLPTFAQIGYAAPVLLVLMRCIQGLALGGEFGGAAVYIAETAPDGKRAFYTSFIQLMATGGLIVAILVVIGIQACMKEESFDVWGWRLPFLGSALLVGISLWVRSKLEESPVYRLLKEAGRTSRSPLRGLEKQYWRRMFAVLFGVVAGQAVVCYTSQVYQIYFMIQELHVPSSKAYFLAGVSMMAAAPFYLFWAFVSDRLGRKWIILIGCLLASVGYWPIYYGMASAVYMTQGNVHVRWFAMSALLFAQMIFVTMVSAPMMAMLAEIFPAKVRYTCISLPYHIGNGEFGGLTPLIATWLAGWWTLRHPSDRHAIFAGLIWPSSVALLTVIVGGLLVKESHRQSIWKEVEQAGISIENN